MRYLLVLKWLFSLVSGAIRDIGFTLRLTYNRKCCGNQSIL